MRLICDTAASCACKIGRSASPATGAGPGATTSARGDHLRERRTGPRRAWRSELPFGCLRIVPQVVRQLAGASFAISNGSAIRLLGLLVPRTPLTAAPCSSPRSEEHTSELQSPMYLV